MVWFCCDALSLLLPPPQTGVGSVAIPWLEIRVHPLLLLVAQALSFAFELRN